MKPEDLKSGFENRQHLVSEIVFNFGLLKNAQELLRREKALECRATLGHICGNVLLKMDLNTVGKDDLQDEILDCANQGIPTVRELLERVAKVNGVTTDEVGYALEAVPDDTY